MNRFITGSLLGLHAWLVFATVQLLCSSLQLWLGFPECCLGRPSFANVVVALGIYAGIGLGCGLILTLLLAGRWPATIAVASMISVLAPVTYQALPAGPGLSRYYLVPYAFLIVVFALRRAISRKGPAWLDGLTSVWAVAMTVHGLRWLTATALLDEPRMAKALAIVIWTAVVTTAGLVLNRWMVSPGAGERFTPATEVARPLRRVLAILAIALVEAILAKGPLPTQAERPASGTDVVLIVLDTVRADHTSVYGYHRDTTPNLRAWGGQATRYARAIASSPHSTPSHASLFTGLYPSWHGAHTIGTPEPSAPLSLAPHFDTVAEILGRAGYQTGAAVANRSAAGRPAGLAQGFAFYQVPSVHLGVSALMPGWETLWFDMTARGGRTRVSWP